MLLVVEQWSQANHQEMQPEAAEQQLLKLLSNLRCNLISTSKMREFFCRAWPLKVNVLST